MKKRYENETCTNFVQFFSPNDSTAKSYKYIKKKQMSWWKQLDCLVTYTTYTELSKHVSSQYEMLKVF